MEVLLFCRYLYDPMEEKGVKPTGKTNGDWKKINRKTIGVNRQWIDQSIYHMCQVRLLLTIYRRD